MTQDKKGFSKEQCIISTAKEILNELLDTGIINTRQAYGIISHLPYPEEVKTEIDSLIDERYSKYGGQ